MHAFEILEARKDDGSNRAHMIVFAHDAFDARKRASARGIAASACIEITSPLQIVAVAKANPERWLDLPTWIRDLIVKPVDLVQLICDIHPCPRCGEMLPLSAALCSNGRCEMRTTPEQCRELILSTYTLRYEILNCLRERSDDRYAGLQAYLEEFIVAPPLACRHCGNNNWQFVEISISRSHTRWRCGSCGRIENINADGPPRWSSN